MCNYFVLFWNFPLTETNLDYFVRVLQELHVQMRLFYLQLHLQPYLKINVLLSSALFTYKVET